MLDFRTFTQVLSLIQVASQRDEDMDNHLKATYDRYLALPAEDREALEEAWRDKIQVPAHQIVKFYNNDTKTG